MAKIFDDTFFTVCLLVLQALLFLLQIIFKDSELKLWFKRTNAVLIILSFTSAFGLFIVTKDEQDALKIADATYKEQLKIELASRDSLHSIQDSFRSIEFQKQIDSSYTKSITASNKALADYNLILIDSMERVSAKVNSKTTPMPQLTIVAANTDVNSPPVYLSNSENIPELKVKFESKNSTCYNINIAMVIFGTVSIQGASKSKVVLYNKAVAATRKFLVNDVHWTMLCPFPKEILQHKDIEILFYGTFTSDYEGNKKQEYYEAVELNNETHAYSGKIEYGEIKKILQYLRDNSYIK